ncbi:MAG: ABC transporter ATP-binding protein [Actinomycetota bacterium]|nr:ABC transporter ATP-binding protein [Actinomycetota bacterium]
MVFDSLRELIRPDRAGAPAIVVEGLTETFRLYHDRPVGLKERLTHPFRTARYTDFNALEDVTFTVEHGESLGLVGHNGSGKSTLLKVLARILPPDRGRVEINGRVASLLELGAGFHGDLTGRENVYLNGAVLGLSRTEVDAQFDAIVDFAGVRAFIDQPVRNYSSGMYVRLGFAIAVHVDPDILLVDEVLSVGDAFFQARSLERMASFQQRGKTVVLVSHDLAAIERLCDRVLVVDHGALVFDGPTREGVQLYSQVMGTQADGEQARPGLGHGDVRVAQASLLDPDGLPVSRVAPSSVLVLRVQVRAERDIEACSAGATFQRGDGMSLYEVHTTWQGLGVGPLASGQTATVEVRFTAHVLAGHYNVTPVVTDPSGRIVYDVLPEPLAFEVTPAPGGIGLVDLLAATAVVEGPSVRLDLGGRESERSSTTG